MGIPFTAPTKATEYPSVANADELIEQSGSDFSRSSRKTEQREASSLPTTHPEKVIKETPVEKIQKSTWRKIRDWLTRAYRISEVAKKRPERVRSVGKHIIMLGMALGFAPNLIASLAKNSKQGDQKSPKNPIEKRVPTPSPKKNSERLQRVLLDSSDIDADPERDSEEDHQEEEQPMDSNAPEIITMAMPQVAMAIHTAESPEIYANRLHNSALADHEISTISVPVAEVESVDRTGEISTTQERDHTSIESNNEPTPLSLTEVFRGREQEIFSRTEPELELINWRNTELSISLYPNSEQLSSSQEKPTRDLDNWGYNLESDIEFDPFESWTIPPIPEQDLIDQLTYEHGEILPLEVAYESLMRVMINSTRQFKRWLKPPETEVDMTAEPRRTNVRLRTGFDDVFSGGDAQLRLSLRRVILKAGIDIELPFNAGEIELESISRVEPFEDMPLTRQTFQMTYEHPLLGGQVQLRGALDIEPSQVNPYTVTVRARFNRIIYDHAALNVEGLYEQNIGSEPFFGITAGIAFIWGPDAAPVQTVSTDNIDSTERRYRRRFSPEQLGERLIRAGRKLHIKQERQHQRD